MGLTDDVTTVAPPPKPSLDLRKWWKAFLVLVALGSVGFWWVSRDVVPRPIRLMTGSESGLNFHLAQSLCDILKSRGHQAQAVGSQGSRENREALLTHRADLAIVKAGSVELEGVEVVAPLYPDLVFVMVRRDRKIERIQQLKGKSILLGRKGSGTFEIAATILRHYGVYTGVNGQDRYFGDI